MKKKTNITLIIILAILLIIEIILVKNEYFLAIDNFVYHHISKLINPVNMKLPEGDYFADIEAPRGIASCFVRSYGEKEPYRLKWRTGSYYSVNLLRKLLVGEYLNDAIAIAGSLDIILPEVDK